MTAIDVSPAFVLQQFSSQMGISVSIPDDLPQGKLISVDYKSQPAEHALKDLARKFDKIAEYDGNIVRFVEADEALRDFVLVRSGYANPSDAVQVFQSMLGQQATVEQIDDRLLITGTTASLKQATKLAEHLTRGADGWLLEVRVVSVSDNFRKTIGLDWNLELNLGLNTTGPGVLTNADALVSIIGQATETGSDATLLQTATLYVMEGSSSQIRQGQTIPVPRFSVSPEGTTTTAGFDYIDAGFTLDATARRVPDGVLLSLEPSISTINGFVQQAPITQESSVRVDVVVNSGTWLVLSGLETAQETKDTKKIPGLPSPIFGTDTDTKDESTLLILVHAKRVYAANGSQQP